MTSLSGLVHVTSLSAVTLWEVGNIVLDLLTCHKSLGLEKKESSVYIGGGGLLQIFYDGGVQAEP